MAPAKREWRGSVFKPADKPNLWLKIKVHGAWKKRSTPFAPGEETKAEALLAEVREELLAVESAMRGTAGPVTVRAWSKRWLEKRPDRTGDDERNLRLHVLPVIGDMLLVEVTPRHIADLVEGWGYDEDDRDAPGARSIGNWYSTCRSLFRDAAVKGLIPATPCILTAPHLPTRQDKSSEWRAGAVFKKPELEQLITPCAQIEEDSTVTYALLGLGALRHGELAALRWRHVDFDREPLGCMLIANSNSRRRTKKGKTRLMPIHPVLAAVLADWKLTGWARLIGRAPAADDLVLPLAPQPWTGRRVTSSRPHLQDAPDTRMRTKDFTWKRAARHLEALKLRHRRVHDLRRTFISLARAAGAEKDVLSWGTHGRSGDIMDVYTEMDWVRLCGEVSKLRVERLRERRLLALRHGGSAEPG